MCCRVNGIDLHFTHKPHADSDAIPLLLIHGKFVYSSDPDTTDLAVPLQVSESGSFLQAGQVLLLNSRRSYQSSPPVSLSHVQGHIITLTVRVSALHCSVVLCHPDIEGPQYDMSCCRSAWATQLSHCCTIFARLWLFFIACRPWVWTGTDG